MMKTDGFPTPVFEPLSPSSSDSVLWPSDCESDAENFRQNPKRRKIERLAQNYLEGKPLLILSASIKGPIQKGWKNPWKTHRQHLVERERSHSDRHVREGISSTGDESHTGYRQRRTPFQSGDLGGYSKKQPQSNQSRANGYSNSKEMGNLKSTGLQSHMSNSPFRSLGSSDNSRSSAESHQPIPKSVSGSSWLRKDREMLRHEVMSSPRSHSPTPAVRSVRDTSQTRPHVQDASNCSHGSESFKTAQSEIYACRFTPVNAIDVAKPKIPKSLAQPPSSVEPASSSSKQLQENLMGALANNVPYSSLYPSHNGLSAQASKPKQVAKDVTKLKTHKSHQGPDQDLSKKITPTLRLNTSASALGSTGHQDHVITTASTSIPIPSAQIVPEKLVNPSQLVSLHSTGSVFHNGNNGRTSSSGLDQGSVQPPPPTTQNSFQENIKVPNNADNLNQIEPLLPSKSPAAEKTSPVEIVPFFSVNASPKIAMLGHTRPEIRRPDEASDFRRVQFGNEPEQADAMGHLDDKNHLDNHMCSDGRDYSRRNSTATPSSKAPPTPPSPPHDKFSSETAGLALPFTLSASTNGTGHQDAQGLPEAENFNLDEAIAAAGSFLQSWDLYAEVSFKTHKSVTSSMGQPSHSVLR